MSEIERAIEKKEYIERGALLKAFGCENAVKYGNKSAQQQHKSYSSMMLYEIADEINDSPAADVEPVVRGEWRDGKCTNCDCYGFPTYYGDNERTTFCPHCGAHMERRITMNEPITPEQAKKLLNAIFAEEDTDEDNYPETITDKVGYAEYVLTHSLGHIGKSLHRLGRLNRLLLVAGKHDSGLPDIITNNELRMALEPLLMVREDVNEITDYLLESYRETKPEDKKLEMREGERSCENCGAKMDGEKEGAE